MLPPLPAADADSRLALHVKDSKLAPTHLGATMAARMKAAERREQILDASLALFASRGFSATKTRDVALAAGVSEAMVFKHFPDKEGLYRALIERKIAEAESALPLAGIAGSREAPAVFFGRIASTILERIERDPSFLRLLLFSALEGHPLAAEFDKARAAGFRTAIEEYLGRQARTAGTRNVDPVFASRAFMALVGWFAVARTVFREPGARRIPREKLVREIVAVFVDGTLRR
jgi:AcrR family transcriptional regulator